MNKIRLIGFVALLGLVGEALAQEYRYDSQCGCDIFFVDGIETTREGELYGFRREDGVQIAPNIYRFVDQFHDGYCKVLLDDGKTGIIDREGRQIVPCIYDDVEYPSEGRVLVLKNDRMGYTDLNGNVVIPLTILYGGSFSEGRAPAYIWVDSTRRACTFIDTNGRQAIPDFYDNVRAYSCGHAMVCRDGRWGVIDYDGNVVLPIAFDWISTMFDSVFFAGNEHGMALYDKRMQPLTPAVYKLVIAEVSSGCIGVERNGHQGFLDRTGREVIPCIYDEIGRFVMGRAMVRLGNRFGIVDSVGRFVLPIEYESRTSQGEKYIYYDSLALVEKDGKVGFVDLDGNLAIPFHFDAAYHFSEGLASVCYKGMWGYIDTHGDIYMPFIFELASPFRWGRADVIYQGLLRKVDRRGRCVGNCNGIIAWRDWTE